MGILVEVIVSAFFSVMVSTGEEVKPKALEKAKTEVLSEVDVKIKC